MSAVPDRDSAVSNLLSIFLIRVIAAAAVVAAWIQFQKNANLHDIGTKIFKVSGDNSTYLTLVHMCVQSQIRHIPIPLLHAELEVGKKGSFSLACNFHANMHNKSREILQLVPASGRIQVGNDSLYTEESQMTWKLDRMVAVKVGIGPTIMLRSGAWLDFCSPATSEFTIEDIAHGLANICRYSGQCSSFYSVAEHSILVSDTAVGFEFEALLHDAAEAFLGDITRPLKQMLPDYKRIEADVERVILDRFGIVGSLPPQVKQADLRVLAAEQKQIMPEGTDGWVRGQKVDPAPIVVRHLPPSEAKRVFLERFKVLHPAYVLRKSKGAGIASGSGQR